MCGRYSLVTNPEVLIENYELDIQETLNVSYNITPTQDAYVLTNSFPTKLIQMKWGLLPSWSKQGNLTGTMINARSEAIFTKPSFRIPIRRQRCLVPADSFYEWRKEGKKKIPYRIMPNDEELLTFAGIWDQWKSHKGVINTFSIITCQANLDVSDIHDRMPLIFYNRSDQKKWLKDIKLSEIEQLMVVPLSGMLKKYRISEAMNSPSFNQATIHDQVKEPPRLF